MKKIIFLFALFSIISNAQSHRFIYEYSTVTDSLKKDSVKTQLMRLNITPEFSEFLPEEKAKADSTIMRNIALNKAFDTNFSSNALSTNSYADYKTGKTKVYAEIGIQQVLVTLDSNPQWKLSGEKRKIGTYNCQKATTNFGGRSWTAWFTTDLPFQEGPYIFKGLPGLIVELQDSTNSHHFLLVGNHNDTNTKSNRFTMGNVVEIDTKKFNKEWKKYRENPIPISTQMQNRGVIFSDDVKFPSANNTEIEGLRKEIRQNNNAILLTLYK